MTIQTSLNFSFETTPRVISETGGALKLGALAKDLGPAGCW